MNCDLLLVEVFVVVLYLGKLCLSLCVFVSIKLWTCAHANIYIYICLYMYVCVVMPVSVLSACVVSC